MHVGHTIALVLAVLVGDDQGPARPAVGAGVVKWPFQHYRKIPRPIDTPFGGEIPPLPKHIIEMLNEVVTDFLEEPCHATAFALGVECEYVGHFDSTVQYAARTVLMLWMPDAGHLLTEEHQRTLNDLMAGL